jgi:hypothetical protein
MESDPSIACPPKVCPEMEAEDILKVAVPINRSGPIGSELNLNPAWNS